MKTYTVITDFPISELSSGKNIVTKGTELLELPGGWYLDRKTNRRFHANVVENMPDVFDKRETRPPLGIMPRRLFWEDRMKELHLAMHRYTIENKPVPLDWVVELNQISLLI